jgi:hypothetical protein
MGRTVLCTARRALASLAIPPLVIGASPDCLIAQSASSAARDSLPDVASLRAPATPAFVLLGISPTDVARPMAPGDVALTLADRSSGLTRLPEDFAMEVSPYWLFPHRRLTWRADAVRRLDQSVARTFALSVGTAKQELESAVATDVGIGARTMLLSGRLSRATIALLDSVERSAAREGGIFNRFRLRETLRLNALQRTEISACLAEAEQLRQRVCIDAVNAKYNTLRTAAEADVRADPAFLRAIAEERATIEDVTLVREGLMWELSAGAVWRFPEQTWRDRDLARWGAWTTVSYEGGELGGGTKWTPIVVARYLAEDTTATLDLFDLGGRLVLSGPSFALSAEYIRRMSHGDDAPPDQDRLSGMLEYKLRPDLWVFAALGRDYDSAESGSLIAQLGLSMSFRRERYAPQ